MLTRLLEILAPAPAAIRLIDPHEKRRKYLAKLRQHLIGAAADLDQRMRSHTQEQRFEALAGAVDAEVRLRCGGQPPAKRVERLGANGGAMYRVRVAGSLGIAGGEMLLHRRN